MMTNTKTTIAIIGIIAASALAITIHTNSVYAAGGGNAANPPQQPTGHFEDPANPNALDQAGGTASNNALPITCGPYDPPLTPPSGCVVQVPEDLPSSLLPPK